MNNKPYPLYNVPEVNTLKELVRLQLGKNPDKVFIMYPTKNKQTAEKTYQQFNDDIDALGTFFYSMGLRNSQIAIIGENSYNWLNAYFSATNGGNVAVPLDKELPAADLAEILKDSGAKAFVYSKAYSDIAQELKDFDTDIEHFICMSELEEYRRQGMEMIEKGNREFCDYDVKSDELACIVYTSGTTGKSKGVMLTHKNLAVDAVATCRNTYGENLTIAILPLHHTFGISTTIFVTIIYNAAVYISKSMKNITKEMAKYKPMCVMLVPVIVETIYKKIWDNAEKQGKTASLKMACRLSNLLMKMGIDKRKSIFHEIHEQFGGNLELIICGGAALRKDVSDGFKTFGIEVVNGYGITECSPVVSVNRNNYNRYGSVGLPLNCNEIKIDNPDADGNGEILVRGDNVMVGYYNNEEATKEAFTPDGWFRTGDIGKIDKDGFVYITGRGKNLIILSNGKNISPEELEEKIVSIPYVEEVVVYDKDEKITAEVFLNEENEPKARHRIFEDIEALNRKIPTYKNIGSIKIRDKEFPKTTTMKIKRHFINK